MGAIYTLAVSCARDIARQFPGKWRILVILAVAPVVVWFQLSLATPITNAIDAKVIFTVPIEHRDTFAHVPAPILFGLGIVLGCMAAAIVFFIATFVRRTGTSSRELFAAARAELRNAAAWVAGPQSEIDKLRTTIKSEPALELAKRLDLQKDLLAVAATHRGTTIQGIAALVQSVVALVLVFGLVATTCNLQVAQQSLRTSEQGQVTDRFTKAIDELGSVQTDRDGVTRPKIEVRIGGIYALERLMHDSPEDQQMIVNVLSAYVRQNMYFSEQEHVPNTTFRPPADIVTILSVLTDSATSATIDLHGADFRNANITGFRLERADLREAHLDYADLSYSRFANSYFEFASLKNASLVGADLRGAFLSGADVTGANFDSVDLTGADLFAIQGLTREQLAQARSTVRTILPEYLR